jgi:hypothetical protein
MNGILERVEKSTRYFTPETEDQFLALQLARSLSALNKIRQIASLVSRYPEPLILGAYQDAQDVADPGARVQHFEQLLVEGRGKVTGHCARLLLAFKLERRVIGAALFRGRHVEESEKRELSADPDKAGRSLDHFLRTTVERLRPELAAIETPPAGTATRRSTLTGRARLLLRELGVPVYEATKQETFEAYSVPACRTRTDLRGVGSRLFPAVSHMSTESPLDAALVGLLIQVRMQLNPTA